MMKVIITGSLGNIGRPLTEALVQKGHQVTVISSKPEKQPAITAMGATAAIGSLEDPDFLSAVLTGADLLFAMVPPNLSVPDSAAYYRRIGGNYSIALQQSGVNRVVHLSSIGAELDKGTGFILGSYYMEGILNELKDVAITHLRPAWFYTNLYSFVNMIKGMGIIGANYGGEDKLVVVHPTDIAAVAAEEIEAPPTHRKVRYIASDERTASEIARIIGAEIGKPDLQWLTFSDEQTLTGLQQAGILPHIAALFVEMGASTHSGALHKDYELHKPITLGKVKVEDFAKEFAAAFNS